MVKANIPLNGDYKHIIYRKYLELVNKRLIPFIFINANRCCYAEKNRSHSNHELAGAGDSF